MVEDHLHFNRRVSKLTRKHQAMSRGYTHRLRSDGLIEVKPRRARPGVSLRALALFVFGFLAFKGFLLANLGPAGYEDRLARLSEGTVVEQGGAALMAVDPVSEFIASKIGPVLR
ncbi:hypothetical protein [Falsiruegeria mediterranea]|jgi:hypothetical protein|uniref:Uncharacterized protein n=1 Tax=Falsiruegeria mediterranea M17 TaxID=1200281 RepID=A0A2R8C775_9RHOB|nr:hypothetical protein [Falsiruegeria mediterranea]SPJ28203.1 hypothetical protein TRM7615_01700 [Falsiruegeria mediterranea M17]